MMQEENFMTISIQVYWYRISEQMYLLWYQLRHLETIFQRLNSKNLR